MCTLLITWKLQTNGTMISQLRMMTMLSIAVTKPSFLHGRHHILGKLECDQTDTVDVGLSKIALYTSVERYILAELWGNNDG